MTVGAKIRISRKEKKMTLAALGLAVGVTPAAVSAWETGRNLPDAKMIGKIAAVLGVPVNFLTGTPAAAEYNIPPEVYELAKIIDSLPEKDRQTLVNVLHALGYRTTASGAEVVPSAVGDQTNRKKK